MAETLIVGAIILAAAAFTVYRIFFRPSCGCGSDCNCSSPSSSHKGSSCCGGKGGGCNCGK